MREQAISQIDASKVRGKVAIVTGGNAGIGVETCYFLLRAGYHVIIGTKAKKQSSAVSIKNAIPSCSPHSNPENSLSLI